MANIYGISVMIFGESDRSVSATVSCYDIKHDRWNTNFPSLNKPRRKMSAVTLGAYVYVACGMGQGA